MICESSRNSLVIGMATFSAPRCGAASCAPRISPAVQDLAQAAADEGLDRRARRHLTAGLGSTSATPGRLNWSAAAHAAGLRWK
jgi:hypothetical protein